MTDRVPQNFLKASEVLQTVDAVDTVTGTGYITLYPAIVSYTPNSNQLVSQITPSVTIQRSQANGFTDTYSRRWGKSTIIEGQTYLICSTNSSAGVSGGSSFALITSGAKVDVIGAETGAVTSGGTSRRQIVMMDIPKTILKKGDYLKLSVTITNTGGEQTTLYIDPENNLTTSQNLVSTGAVGDTDFKILLPVKLLQ